jgi:hypothetical protein
MTKQTIFSRRNLLGALAAGGAAAAALAAPALPLSWTRRPSGTGLWNRGAVPLARAGIGEWSRQIGTTFTVEAETGSASLKLVKVVPLQSGGRRPASLGRDRAFAAVFEASGPAPAGDATYRMEHEAAGKLDVFMTPGRPGSAPRLEAVFG